ncbi:MAG: DUF2207 domain-containing protein [Propionibacteriaceae bacterium]|nr:DUF2207 domain-containing protein [Propionibacteriaceae bacterium]
MAKWATGFRRLGAVLAVAVGLLACIAPSARAADAVASYLVKATINADGTLAVKATLTFNGAAPDQVQQVFDTVVTTADRMEYHYRLTDVAASTGGKDLGATVSEASGSTTVTIPTGGASTAIELDYTVHGAAMATANDTTTVAWPYLQGLDLAVDLFEAVVEVPGLPTLIDCEAGDPASPGACTYYSGATHENFNPTFHHEAATPGQVVIGVVRFPTNVVAVNQDVREIWSLDRAFSAAPLPLGIALGVLVLGGLALWAAHRRIGRDATVGGDPVLVAEFAPIGPGQSEFRVLDGVRPGEVGTLVDERVDPIDVTATLLDLAVRGHLRITELPLESAHATSDWTFARRQGADTLLDYEHTLLDAVAPVQGDPVQVSNLAGSVGAVIGDVQSQLYDEVVKRGWFARRPDSTRNQWALIGWVGLGVAVVVTIVLAAFTHFGLAGLALIAIALGVVLVGQEMPARTATGTGVLTGLDVLRGSLLTQPVDTLPTGRGYQQMSALLPYAVVLGGKERWLQAMADSDDDDLPDSTDLDWYHGPDSWHLADLPASLANFVTTVQGTLFSR